MTATLVRSATPFVPPLARRGGRRLETVLCLIAIALIAVHVIDDNYLQPQPGMSPGDHVVSGSSRWPCSASRRGRTRGCAGPGGEASRS